MCPFLEYIEKEYLSPKRASELIGCSSNTVISWCKKGYVLHIKKKVGLKNMYRIEKQSLLRYFEERKKEL